MISKLNIPVSIPWTKKAKWEEFGDKFDLVELDGNHISIELRQLLSSMNLKVVACSKFAVFPNTTQTMYVDSPWCEVDNHSRIVWVDGADVEITWYDITEPLGLENIEKLFDVKTQTDDDTFTDKRQGWIVKRDVLKEVKREVIKAGEIALINAGVPHTITAITPVRAKLYLVGVERENKIVVDNNGMVSSDACVKFEEFIK